MSSPATTVRRPVKEGDVEEFVTQFLTSLGAKVKIVGSPSNPVLQAQLPDDVARLLETDRTVRLTFSRTDVKTVKAVKAEYITFGHPLLDRMVSLAKQKGLTSNLIFSFSIAPDFIESVMALDPFHPHDRGAGGDGWAGELMRQAEAIKLHQGKIRTISRKLTHQRQLLFFFKVSMISDEKWEETIPLFIDPLTETVDRPVDIRQAVSFAVPRPADTTDSEAYKIERLYRVACDHLRERLKGRMTRFEQDSGQRAETEKRRIEEYYRGLATENLEPLRQVFRRISAVGMKAELARTWRTEHQIHEETQKLKTEAQVMEEMYRSEMESLDKERIQRLFEVDEKYRARVEIALTHGAYVMVPRIEWHLRLESSGVRREEDLVYDVMRRRFVNWQCEHCEDRLIRPGHLCSCEALVCEQCVSHCSSCGQNHCAVCLDERCHMCDRLTCSVCDTACPIGYGLVVCHSCRTTWCNMCRSASLFHVPESISLGIP